MDKCKQISDDAADLGIEEAIAHIEEAPAEDDRKENPLENQAEKSNPSSGENDSKEEGSQLPAAKVSSSHALITATEDELGKDGIKSGKLVRELKCSEIRWFYKKENDSKWISFRGYDSVVLEIAYRKHKGMKLDEEVEALSEDLPMTEDVIVLNGLYKVARDVSNEEDDSFDEISSIYYKQETLKVLRGSWFSIDTMQPLVPDLANAIEEHHLKHYLGHEIPEKSVLSDNESIKPAVLSSMKWNDNEEVKWYSAIDVSFSNLKKSNRIIRFVTRSRGTIYLQRGYIENALLEDGKPNFSDLILVVHGIGQKGYQNLISENTTQVREGIINLMEKNYPNEKRQPIILPIEWRCSLTLDNGLTDVVTLPRVSSVRTTLNSVAMDIMYYQSPLYRTEIVNGVIKSLNKVYSTFKKNNPAFNGSVSLFAHSLGSVIVYDILTNWSHCAFYDEFVMKAIKSYIGKCDENNDERLRLENFYNSRKNLSETDGVMKKVLADGKESELLFKVKYLFCVGSPLAVFIIMRGGDYSTMLPKPEQVERVFNIFHPYDPIAYRLEPLFHDNYRHIRPLRLVGHTNIRRSYDQMMFECHKSYLKKMKKEKKTKRSSSNLNPGTCVELEKKESEKDDDCCSLHTAYSSSPTCLSPPEILQDEPNVVKKPVRNWWNLKAVKSDDVLGVPAKGLPATENNNKGKTNCDDLLSLPDNSDSKIDTETNASTNDPGSAAHGAELMKQMGEAGKLIDEIPNDRRIPYRMDFQIEPALTEKTYWSVLKSHFAYWTNLDVTEFVLSTIFSEEPLEFKQASTESPKSSDEHKE